MLTGALSPDRFPGQSKAVPAPTAVRYAYRGFPMGNLYNEEGFPAAQFEAELK